METPNTSNTKLAALKVDGKVIDTGTFAFMKSKERTLLNSGYKKSRIQVGYAPYYNGLHHCAQCHDPVIRPYVQNYDGHEYYTCAKCQKTNYVS